MIPTNRNKSETSPYITASIYITKKMPYTPEKKMHNTYIPLISHNLTSSIKSNQYFMRCLSFKFYIKYKAILYIV